MVRFFRTSASLRAWLEKNHANATELWIGFYKKGSGKTAVTYHEALDEALCFGWIDGIRRRVDEISYTNRFTPRQPRSNWSRININRAQELRELGRMTPAGLNAFAARDPQRSGSNVLEQKSRKLDAASVRQFRVHPAAWKFFNAQPPGYRRMASLWVMSGKRAATRERRLQILITASASRRRAPPFERRDGR